MAGMLVGFVLGAVVAFAALRVDVRSVVGRVRMARLRTVWKLRAVRGRVALAYRLRVIKRQERRGYARSVVALVRVCVPVWWTRWNQDGFPKRVGDLLRWVMEENAASVQFNVYWRTGRML